MSVRSQASWPSQPPPGNTTTEHENNAREASPVCQARSPTLRLGRRNWQKRFDQLPQRIRNEHASHLKVPPTVIESRTVAALLGGLLQAFSLFRRSRDIENQPFPHAVAMWDQARSR